MRLYLPYRSEFGFVCMVHAPQVHADPHEKIVCCEPGYEALYPSASAFVEVPARKCYDDRREWREPEMEAGIIRCYPDAKHIACDFAAPRRQFKPEPLVSYAIDCDVVIVPRRRDYGGSRNWPHWLRACELLKAAGLKVFAAGSADASENVNCESAWDYARNIDASLSAMRTAKLVLCGATGFMHLAVMAACPVSVIAHGDGLESPSTDRRINFDWLLEQNHMGVEVERIRDGWHDPEGVVRGVVQRCA